MTFFFHSSISRTPQLNGLKIVQNFSTYSRVYTVLKYCLALFCSIRALYGTDEQKNAVHGSVSYLGAEREIRFFFHDSQYEFNVIK